MNRKLRTIKEAITFVDAHCHDGIDYTINGVLLFGNGILITNKLYALASGTISKADFNELLTQWYNPSLFQLDTLLKWSLKIHGELRLYS